MKSIGFTFDHLYLVVYPFQATGINRVVSMVEYSVFMASEELYEILDMSIVNTRGHLTPAIKCLLTFLSIIIVEN